MLASDVCLMCVHTQEQSIEALAGEDGLLAVGTKAMADKVGKWRRAEAGLAERNGGCRCTRLLDRYIDRSAEPRVWTLGGTPLAK